MVHAEGKLLTTLPQIWKEKRKLVCRVSGSSERRGSCVGIMETYLNFKTDPSVVNVGIEVAAVSGLEGREVNGLPAERCGAVGGVVGWAWWGDGIDGTHGGGVDDEVELADGGGVELVGQGGLDMIW